MDDLAVSMPPRSEIIDRMPPGRRPYILAQLAVVRSVHDPSSAQEALRGLQVANAREQLTPPLPSVLARLISDALKSTPNGFGAQEVEAAQLLLVTAVDFGFTRAPGGSA